MKVRGRTKGELINATEEETVRGQGEANIVK